MIARRVDVNAGSVVSGLGLVTALTVGAVWTATAVVDGKVAATAIRFLVAIGAGLFYHTLFRLARRPRP